MELLRLFSQISDHRGRQGKHYSLASLLALTLLGKLCGYNGLASISRFAKRLSEKDRQALGIYNGRTPCHSTYTETFRGLDIEHLESLLSEAFSIGDKQANEGLEVSMDGKRLRGSRHDESDGVHLLGLFGHKCQSLCGQTELKEDENEISAALRLLQSVNLEGLIITGDAVFAQKNSAKPS